MSLDFSASTHRVAVPASSSLDNLTAFTVLFWLYNDTFTNDTRVWIKGDFSGSEPVKHFSANSTGSTNGAVFEIARVTQDALMFTDEDVMALGLWKFIAITYDESDGGRVFHGSRTVTVAESGYSTRQVGSGATRDDSTINMNIGNGTTGESNAIDGRIAVCSIFNIRLTLAAIIRMQFRILNTLENVGYWHLGYNGTGTQFDYSGNGNVGTVTGAAVADHVPLLFPFGFVTKGDFAVTSAITVSLNTLTLTSSAEALAVIPIPLNALILAGSSETLTVVPGAVSVSVNTLTLASSAQALFVIPIPLNTLTLAGSAKSLTVIPGAVSVTFNTLTLASSAVVLNVAVDQIVSLNTLTLAGSAVVLTVVPGAVSVTVNTLTLASSSQVLFVIPVSLSTLTLASQPRP